jgi:hypothetical protein
MGKGKLYMPTFVFKGTMTRDFDFWFFHVGAISNCYENLRIFANEYFSRVSTVVTVDHCRCLASPALFQGSSTDCQASPSR